MDIHGIPQVLPKVPMMWAQKGRRSILARSAKQVVTKSARMEYFVG